MIIIKPLLTEKTLANAKKNLFTFLVNPKAGKHQIRKAVGDQFGVTVTSLHTIKLKSRKVRSRKTGRYITVKAQKKAIVSLKDKQTIDLFDVKNK